jgi:hypothetical protein
MKTGDKKRWHNVVEVEGVCHHMYLKADVSTQAVSALLKSVFLSNVRALYISVCCM